MSEKRTAIYPGSFDPLTLGHVDIIERGAGLFDTIVVSVLRHVDKEPLFSVEDRLKMIRETFVHRDNVEADSFAGLLVDHANKRGANVIVRGLRAISDFEYEFQMALMNRRLAINIETVFMMPAQEYSFVSSRMVKEVARLGGDISGLVPPGVELQLKDKLNR